MLDHIIEQASYWNKIQARAALWLSIKDPLWLIKLHQIYYNGTLRAVLHHPVKVAIYIINLLSMYLTAGFMCKAGRLPVSR